MSVSTKFLTYFFDDRGAVTVDWTVLSSAAVGLALATTAVMTEGIDAVSARMDTELRDRQLSDEWVQFYASHFEPILETGVVSEATVEALYDAASEMMNHDVMTSLTAGIEALEAGTITGEELIGLVAVASVAYQRNIVDDGILNHYFGFDGSDPHYMTLANAQASGA